MKIDERIGFSPSQKNIHKHLHVPKISQSEFYTVLRTPKKTRLEQPINETAASVKRIIRGARVERLSDYFEQTCDRRQHDTAVIYEPYQLTYQDLDQRANRLAHFLISHSIGKGTRVGILLDRSLETYITLLGVLKAGAAFVPLDPSFPSGLLAFITKDAGLNCIVTASTFRAKTSHLSCPVLELDRAYEAVSVQSETRPQVRIDPTSPCYIIYTFSSTGKPKGVVVSHTNIVNFLRVITLIYDVTHSDRVYQGMSIALDLSFQEIWPTWIAGATLVTGPSGPQQIGMSLTEFLVKHRITVLCCAPTLLATIESDVSSLRLILLGGEACPADLVRRWSRSGRWMLNTYGSTETTVMTTWPELFPGSPNTVVTPVPTNPVRLDENSANGERCIGGPGVASQVNQVSHNIYDIGTSKIPSISTERSKFKILSQLNLKNVYKHIMTDPLYKNSLFQMASTFILGGLGFVFWMIIARLYKAENVGIATTLISIMTLLCSFTSLGLNSSLMRYLPKSANKNELINSAFVIVTFITFLVTIIFLLGLRIFSPQLTFLDSSIFYIVTFIIFVIFCAWNTLVESTFMAFRSASNILIKNTIISVLKLMLPFALVTLGAYGIYSSAASALALGVFASLIILILKYKIRPSFSTNISLVKETAAYSFANYMTSFMINAPSLVLPVIILNVLSAEYAAYYYIASMIQNILLIIPLATTQALLTEGSYNEAELKEHVKKAIATIFVILTPAIMIIVIGGKILLQFFGKNYATEAFQFLQLYSVSTFFTSILLIANAINNVKHRKKTLVTSNVIASVLTLWLSYAFTSGKLVGIGWGWTIGQTIAGLISIFFILQVFSSKSDSKVLDNVR